MRGAARLECRAGRHDLLTAWPSRRGVGFEWPTQDPLRRADDILATVTLVRAGAGREADALRPRRGASLAEFEHWEIVPRAGKPALICVDVVTPALGRLWELPVHATLVVRDARRAWTREMREVRAAMGLPPEPPETTAQRR